MMPLQANTRTQTSSETDALIVLIERGTVCPFYCLSFSGTSEAPGIVVAFVQPLILCTCEFFFLLSTASTSSALLSRSPKALPCRATVQWALRRVAHWTLVHMVGLGATWKRTAASHLTSFLPGFSPRTFSRCAALGNVLETFSKQPRHDLPSRGQNTRTSVESVKGCSPLALRCTARIRGAVRRHHMTDVTNKADVGELLKKAGLLLLSCVALVRHVRLLPLRSHTGEYT